MWKKIAAAASGVGLVAGLSFGTLTVVGAAQQPAHDSPHVSAMFHDGHK